MYKVHVYWVHSLHIGYVGMPYHISDEVQSGVALSSVVPNDLVRLMG